MYKFTIPVWWLLIFDLITQCIGYRNWSHGYLETWVMGILRLVDMGILKLGDIGILKLDDMGILKLVWHW